MSEAPTVLRASGVEKHIPITKGAVLKRRVGTIKAVNGVDLELRKGEILGLVGESGCGKSTLAKLLTALDRPTAGEITLLGERLDRMSGRRLRQARGHIQLVFQDPYTSLDPRMTIEGIVGEAFWADRRLTGAARRQRVAQLLEMVGLNPDRASWYPHQFSGGQRQRVGIARALALEPEVLVCDEPVSALDVSVQAQIVNLLASLRAELGVAAVFIAHDLAVVQHLADRVAVMYLGRIVEQGQAEEIYDRPAHPYTQALLSAMSEPDPGLRGRHNRIRLTGEVPSPVDPPSGCPFRTRCWRARELCASEPPPLQQWSTSAGHQVACYFPGLQEEGAGRSPVDAQATGG